ncbi:MAG TPA: hypothetical protein VN915_11255 [Elusimicrobiota bacterium]|nr:hypothetical protein [Elusimicrobiota bacterium]
MKGFCAIGLILAAAVCAAGQGNSGTQSPVIGGTIAVEDVNTVTKILDADAKHRTLTFKDPAGKKVTVGVPPEVSLDQLKKGSKIDVRYVEATALAIGKPGTPPAAAADHITLTPRSGPAAEAVSTTRRVTGAIEDIDRSKRQLTVKGPDGKNIKLKVPPSVPNLEQVKIGDTAVVDYTQAMAFSAMSHPGK